MADTPEHEQTLRDLVEQRLRELRRNPFQAARIAGLERGFVNDILIGRKRSVRGSNLSKLAIGLDCDPNYLIGRQDSAKLEYVEGPGIVRVIGEAAAGIWVDSGLEGVDEVEFSPSPFPPDSRFPVEAQFDMVVHGTSLNRFARDGQRLRCAFFEQYPFALEDNDIVIVERYRGDLRERTAKRWRMRQGKAELWPDSDDPRWQQPLIVDRETSFAEGDLIRVFGVVLYVYDTPRPMK
ncbi:MAG: hypothetical protein LBR29_06585 [Methylobacteriaceae bacterium]|jgi:hypothetical protein|nr:hypothetical protein [Methylobacteriaceae bacterium]